jgi:nicotinate (nicotinamide) nucleotide adenylyltransferase/non-canonical purine NTP pyrophosphatase (RdgB/HAM1 family)
MVDPDGLAQDGGVDRRIGVFGGSFDPVHHGHLIMADAAIEALGLERLLLVPARRNPLKADPTSASGEHRRAMLEQAVAGDARMVVHGVDLERPAPSYTRDTLRLLRSAFDADAPVRPVELFFLLGVDSLRSLPRWRDPAGILALARLALVERPGHALEVAELEGLERAVPGLSARLVRVPAPRIEISATDLRRRATAGLSLRYRVPRAVADYVREHDLYRTPGTRGAVAGEGKRLLLATTNPGKLRELRALLARLAPGLATVTPSELGLVDFDVAETGATFLDNAVLKAQAWAEASGLPALADDSGLEVDALDGEPGVHSARWVDGTDEDRVTALLRRLADRPAAERDARYRAVAALCAPDGALLGIGSGEVEGRIGFARRGAGGFGYDPVFLVVDGGHDGQRTMAELSDEAKNALSHRARAVAGLEEILRHLAGA